MKTRMGISLVGFWLASALVLFGAPAWAQDSEGVSLWTVLEPSTVHVGDTFEVRLENRGTEPFIYTFEESDECGWPTFPVQVTSPRDTVSATASAFGSLCDRHFSARTVEIAPGEQTVVTVIQTGSELALVDAEGGVSMHWELGAHQVQVTVPNDEVDAVPLEVVAPDYAEGLVVQEVSFGLFGSGTGESECAETGATLLAVERALGEPVIVSPYPVTFQPTPDGHIDAVAAQLGESIDIMYLRLQYYGGFVSQLNTLSPTYGGDSDSCTFTQSQVDAWADLLASHASLFGLDRTFTVEPSPEGDFLSVYSPVTSDRIDIRRSPYGQATIEGHWWPGLDTPSNALTEAEIRARAGDYPYLRSEEFLLPTACEDGAPCYPHYQVVSVYDGPLSDELIAQIYLQWSLFGHRENLEVRLLANIHVQHGNQLWIDAVTGARLQNTAFETAALSSLISPDDAQAILGGEDRE